MKIIPHQTVGWWIKELMQYPADKPVVLCTGSFEPFSFFLSAYPSTDERAVIIDVGDEE